MIASSTAHNSTALQSLGVWTVLPMFQGHSCCQGLQSMHLGPAVCVARKADAIGQAVSFQDPYTFL